MASCVVPTPSAAERAATAERHAQTAEEADSAVGDTGAARAVADAAASISRAAVRAYGAWSGGMYQARGPTGTRAQRGDELDHSAFVMEAEDPADDDDEREDEEDHAAGDTDVDTEGGPSCGAEGVGRRRSPKAGRGET